MKLLITLLIAFSSNIYAQVIPLTIGTYFNKIKALNDSDLIEHFANSPQFGECHFRRSISAAATCKYTVLFKNGEKICLTRFSFGEADKRGVIGLVAPNSPADPNQKKEDYFQDKYRDAYANILTNVDKLAATILRDKFLDLSQNSTNCGVSSSDIPSISNQPISAFNTSNTQFFQKTTSSTNLFCKSSALSRSTWNYNTCAYEVKDRYLPLELCKTIFRTLSKLTEVDPSVTSPTIALLSAAQEEEIVKQELEAADLSIAAVTSKPPVEEAIQAEQLFAIENINMDNTTINSCCTNSSSDGHEALTELKKAYNDAPSDFEKPSYLNVSGVTAAAAGSFLNSSVLPQYSAALSNLSIKATSIEQSYELSAGSLTVVAQPVCTPPIAVFVPAPMALSM